MVVVALLSVDLVSVDLVVNCIIINITVENVFQILRTAEFFPAMGGGRIFFLFKLLLNEDKLNDKDQIRTIIYVHRFPFFMGRKRLPFI